jgi:hypothetical protein
LENTTESFTRKVTTALMQSISHIVDSIKSDIPEILISQEGKVVISSNLCEALLQMEPEKEKSNLHIACSWSRMVPPSQTIPSRVRIPKEYFRTIEEVGRKLRPQKEPKLDSFIGRIAELRGGLNKEGLLEGEAIFTCLSQENEPLTSKVYLKHDDYMAACDAHKQVKHVRLEGILHRRPRIHSITDYRNFQVID